MVLSNEFQLKTFGRLKQGKDESGSEFYKRLQSFYGCRYCEDYGDNGCGCWIVGGYEFNGAEEGPDGETIVGGPEGIFHDEWGCAKREREQHYEELIEQKKTGTLVFDAAIKKAIQLAPDEETVKASYGDIVRSAAAVSVAMTGKLLAGDAE